MMNTTRFDIRKTTLGTLASGAVLAATVLLVPGLLGAQGSATCNGQAATIVGTTGNDVLMGTNGVDVIVGMGGDDVIKGFGGRDVICGGSGDDTINGGQDPDTIYGGSGADNIAGGRGADMIEGSNGADVIQGNKGADTLLGGNGDDKLNGNTGADTINGNGGEDTLNGGNGNDKVNGNGGTDTHRESAGSDVLDGVLSSLAYGPIANDDTTSGHQPGTTVIFPIGIADNDQSNNFREDLWTQEEAIRFFDSYTIVGQNANGLLIVPGEGTWNSDPVVGIKGTASFTPAPGFFGSPTPVQYHFTNLFGERSTLGTLTINYN